MDVITYTDARASLKDVMDRVINDHVDVVVTRKNREAVVMVSLDEYNAIQETLHLQKSPENARRLQGAIAQLEAGGGASGTSICEDCAAGGVACRDRIAEE